MPSKGFRDVIQWRIQSGIGGGSGLLEPLFESKLFHFHWEILKKFGWIDQIDPPPLFRFEPPIQKF